MLTRKHQQANKDFRINLILIHFCISVTTKKLTEITGMFLMNTDRNLPITIKGETRLYYIFDT